MSAMGGLRRIAAAAVVASMLATGAGARADWQARVGALPAPASDYAAAALNGTAYLFGGNQVIGVDLSSARATVLIDDTRGPWPHSGPRAPFQGTAVVDREDILLFVPLWDDYGTGIFRYRPATNAYTRVGIQYDPYPAPGIGAFSDGTEIYVLGFGSIWDDPKRVWRYNRSLERLVDSGHRLPARHERAAVVWHDGAAYIIGGLGSGRRITRFVPASGAMDVMTTEAPTVFQPLHDSAALSDGSVIFLFGGSTGNTTDPREPQARWHDTIWAYEPATESIKAMATRLPRAQAQMAAVWDDQGRALLLGGYWGEWCERWSAWLGCVDYRTNITADIVRYSAAPTMRQSTTSPRAIQNGTGALVTWSSPVPNSWAGPLHYELQRREGSAGPWVTIAEPTSTSYLDEECPSLTLCFYRVGAVSSAGHSGFTTTTAAAPGL